MVTWDGVGGWVAGEPIGHSRKFRVLLTRLRMRLRAGAQNLGFLKTLERRANLCEVGHLGGVQRRRHHGPSLHGWDLSEAQCKNFQTSSYFPLQLLKIAKIHQTGGDRELVAAIVQFLRLDTTFLWKLWQPGIFIRTWFNKSVVSSSHWCTCSRKPLMSH
jgi:hypothetical protein